MIVKLRVLISLKTYAMTRASGSRQKRRRRTAVKVVNDVVTGRPQLSRNTRTRHKTTALQRNHLVDMRMTVEQRRDPIFHEHVDFSIGQKASQCEERRRGKHRVANRPQTHQ